ncbi:MAG: 50S ribosomal protein L10 [Patescibacteria group bacterium]
MPITKAKKQTIVSALVDRFKQAETVVFVNFRGLNVASANELRRDLRERAVGYTVAKKTLLRRALADSGRAIRGECPELAGEVAMAYGVDAIAPAREIHRFQQKIKEGLIILGGIFAGEYVDAARMTELAAIPGREILYAELLNLFNSPIAGLVRTVNAIATKNN